MIADTNIKDLRFVCVFKHTFRFSLETDEGEDGCTIKKVKSCAKLFCAHLFSHVGLSAILVSANQIDFTSASLDIICIFSTTNDQPFKVQLQSDGRFSFPLPGVPPRAGGEGDGEREEGRNAGGAVESHR